MDYLYGFIWIYIDLYGFIYIYVFMADFWAFLHPSIPTRHSPFFASPRDSQIVLGQGRDAVICPDNLHEVAHPMPGTRPWRLPMAGHVPSEIVHPQCGNAIC